MKARPLALRPGNPSSPSSSQADRDAAQNEAFLREVDDALREDQFVDFLRRYGKPVGTVVVAGLVALAGYLWWDSASKQADGERGEQLTMALDRVENGHLDSADKQLAALTKDASGGSAAAAMLMRAGIALEKGKTDEALRLFSQVSTDEDAPQPYRDLATIRLMATDFDRLPADNVVARLKPLAEPGSPWFASAGELLAMAYLKQGNEKLAGPLFAAIARDKEAPDTLRRRARQMAGLLGVDAVDDPEKILEEAGKPQ